MAEDRVMLPMRGHVLRVAEHVLTPWTLHVTTLIPHETVLGGGAWREVSWSWDRVKQWSSTFQSAHKVPFLDSMHVH